MRRTFMGLALLAGLLALAGCGNKGPLVRAGTPAAVPAPATSARAPAAATSTAHGVTRATTIPAGGPP